MTQAQLLALDTILPTVLGCVGLVFLAAAIWPMGSMSRAYATRSAAFALVGIGCLAVGVWLFLAVLRTAGQLVVQQLPPPGGTTSITTAQRPSPSPSVTALASAAASGAAASAAASPSTAASPSPLATASASVAASAPTAGPTTVPPTPTIPTNLTPVAAVPFQPENTPAHAAVIGVESFEHGSMLYRDDLKQIYVMTLDQKFKAYPDTWKEGTNPDLGYAPQGASKLTPGRGFGWLWASDPDVRTTLGSALTPEQGFTGSISGDGTTTIIRADVTYAFNKTGTWALK
ncbi:MAG TPA: hypothetical protein VMW62_16110 [Chloroflexota bacterium]|nr:hypothetical protein [Chloroflexota bacterium]